MGIVECSDANLLSRMSATLRCQGKGKELDSLVQIFRFDTHFLRVRPQEELSIGLEMGEIAANFNNVCRRCLFRLLGS